MRAKASIAANPASRARRLGAAVTALVLVVSCSSATPGSPSGSPSASQEGASASPSEVASPTSPVSPSPSASSTIAGTWIQSGKLKVARIAPHLVLLRNDRVLVVGNDNHCTELEDPSGKIISQRGALPESVRAELWNASTSAWTMTRSLDKPRDHFGAVVLANGRVLVAGGVNQGIYSDDYHPLGYVGHQSFSSAWTFDPKRNAWSRTSLMNTARTDPSIALLTDGRVLVAGGIYEDYLREWTGAGTGSTMTAGAAMTGTGSSDTRAGRFADVGPSGPPVPILSTAELYDPRTDTWTRTGSMHHARSGAVAVTLTDGRVLVVGQSPDTLAADRASWDHPYLPDPAAFKTAELFNPRTGRFSLTGSLPAAVASFSLVALDDGGALLIGGYPMTTEKPPVRTVLRFDPKTKDWTRVDSLATARANALAVRLADGRVLVAGGESPYGPTASAELFDPATGRWSALPSMPAPRAWGAAILLRDGSVLIVGGYGPRRAGMTEVTCPTGLATSVRFVPTP